MTLLNQHTNKAQPVQPLSTTSQAPAAPSNNTAAAATTAPATETQEQLEERCQQLMNKHKVVLFMKGNPSAPKCGFSRQTVGLLREKGIEFAWFDILSDQGVRETLKKLNDWPSALFSLFPFVFLNLCWPAIAHPPCVAFPQIILNGELIGGLDIFRESLENGEFDEMYAAAGEETEPST
jgi:glutaredoxin-related protein